MPGSGRCPDESLLRAWLNGAVSDQQCVEIADHCDSCLSCESRLEALEATLSPLQQDLSTQNELEAMELARRLTRKQSFFSRGPLSDPIDELPRIDGYDILRELGRGGMGIVYEAIHKQLARRVALKVLPTVFNTDESLVRRFEAEARAAAGFHHSNIVPVFEFGRSGDYCFFSMQLIEGVGLDSCAFSTFSDGVVASVVTSRLNAEPQSGKERAHAVARIGVQVCAAIAYAHSRGVLHRDVKPSNLILDNAGTIWVTDFGLAKTPDLDLTQSGTILGTIRYMAPERLRGVPCEIVGDVYSVGVTLYELLAGRPAFAGDDYLRTLESVAAGDAPSLQSVVESVPIDLRTIIEKAMHREPSRRYQSCEELGEDLRRFLDGRPISARQVRAYEKVWLWSKTHPSLAIAISAIVALLLIGFTSSAVAVAYFYQQKNYQAELARELEVKRESNRQDLYFAEMNLASPIAVSDSGGARLRELASNWLPVKGERDLRGWEWYFFAACSQAESLIIDQASPVHSVDWHPQKAMLLTSGPGTVYLWSAESGDLLWYETFDKSYFAVNSVAWSPDGSHFAAVSLSGLVQIWNLEDTKVIAQVQEDAAVGSVCWHPSGQSVVYRTHPPDARMIALVIESGEQICVAENIGGDVNYAFGFNPQGTMLASVSQEDTQYQLGIWRLRSEADWYPTEPRKADVSFDPQLWPLSALAWNPEGTLLAQASFDGSIRIWNSSDGEQLAVMDNSNSLPITSLDWDSPNSLLAAGGDDGIVRVIAPSLVITPNLNQPTTLPILFRGHSAKVESLKWGYDGTRLASASGDESIRIWELKEPAILRGQLPDQGAVPRLQWGIYPEQLTAMLSGHLATWNVNQGSILAHVYGMEILDSFDGRYRAVLAHDRNYIEEYGNDAAEMIPFNLAVNLPDTSTQSAWSENSNSFAYASPALEGIGLKVLSFSSQSAAPRTHEILNCEQVYALAWHPLEDWIAVSYYPLNGDGRKRVVIVDVVSGTILAEVQFTKDQVHSFAWSPDGSNLAIGCDDGELKIYDLGSRQLVSVLEGHTRDVRSLAWHPDGDRLASGSDDRTLKIWDTSGGHIAASFAHAGEVRALAWDKPGWRLASASASGEVVVWNAANKYRNER